jgi:integrase
VERNRNNGLRKICGCPRRTWAKCPHSWHFGFKPKGGPRYRFSVDSEVGEHVASKTDAEARADAWRSAIRAGTFRRQGEEPAVPHASTDVITLGSFWRTYEERLGRPVSLNGRSSYAQMCAFEMGGRPFGEKALAAVTEDDIEVFLSHLRAKGLTASTRNKYIQIIKAVFRWATKKGYLTRNPADDSVALRREKHAKRDRRLEDGEEARLLEHASPHLQRLIIATLETGCRRGELLELQWREVNLKRREMTLRSENTKTRTGRVVPLSARLVAILEMAKTDPDGHEFGPDAHVFGDAIGRKVSDIKKAWETAVLRSRGHKPAWTGENALSAASREAFRAVNLTFHDLRHEAGSRLLEAGWPLHNVAHMLGHANISQTSTYLNATRVGLQESMRRLDDSRGKIVASETPTKQPPLRHGEAEQGSQVTVN